MDGAERLAPWLDRPGSAGIFTDFDGTLSPIVADPQRARPLAGVPEVLAGLANRYRRVTVVSGRPISYLMTWLGGVDGLILVGLYGLERARGGRIVEDPAASGWRERVQSTLALAEAEMPSGVGIESKGLSMVLHTRSRPDQLAWVEAWANRQAEATGLAAHPGRMSVELRPPVGGDKGDVVTELGAGLDAVCFLGDDRGDLPAFTSLRSLATGGAGEAGGVATLAVAVASDETPPELLEQADLVVDGPAGALAFLRELDRSAEAQA